MSDLKRALEAEAQVKRLLRVIKRLKSAQGWQPIETATPPGADLLVMDYDGIAIAKFNHGRWTTQAGLSCSPIIWFAIPPVSKATP
jgi:hypothetical protein